jgi:hypothetical protein
MRAILLLADAAQVSPDQKIHALGLGWSFTGPQFAGPMALVAIIEVGWNEANRRHPWRIELQDSDGQPALIPPENQPIVIDGAVEVGRPPGHPEGTPLLVPLSIGFGPIPLPPGRRYVFVMSIDGQTHPDWQVAFNMRPLQQANELLPGEEGNP